MNKNYQTAVLGGGCFWCLEAVYQLAKGIIDIRPGYAGGPVDNPTYEQVTGGETGHAEVIKITFDPKEISYNDILEVFFTVHDPTTLNRQGNDVGPQYRSIIFYENEQQKKTIDQVLSGFAKDLWGDQIVTEIKPLVKYYPAESYHKNYFRNNPEQAYCQLIINPKLIKFKKKFQSLLAK